MKDCENKSLKIIMSYRGTETNILINLLELTMKIPS